MDIIKKGINHDWLQKINSGNIFYCLLQPLIYAGIREGADLVGLSTVVAALAGGTFGVVWGNIKENSKKEEL